MTTERRGFDRGGPAAGALRALARRASPAACRGARPSTRRSFGSPRRRSPAMSPRRRYVALGAGLPEEIGRVVFEAGRLGELTFLVESGVSAGLPAPGVVLRRSVRAA